MFSWRNFSGSAWDIKAKTASKEKEIQRSANENNFLLPSTHCHDGTPKNPIETPPLGMKTQHLHTNMNTGTWARVKGKKKVFALKLNKLEKKEKRKVLCYCCTCDGISVSRGKKSFVQVMLLCTFFSPSSGVCLFIAVFSIRWRNKEGVSSLPTKKTVCMSKGEERCKPEGKILLFALSPNARISVFFQFSNWILFFLGKGETRKKMSGRRSPREAEKWTDVWVDDGGRSFWMENNVERKIVKSNLVEKGEVHKWRHGF